MSNLELFNKYVNDLASSFNKKRDALCDSSYQTFDDYRYACGYLSGIKYAYELLKGIDKEFRDDFNDDYKRDDMFG